MNDEVNIHPRFKGPLRTLKVGNQVFKSAYDYELTAENFEKARRELGETEEKKEQCLREIKERLSKHPSITLRQDDSFLLRYLRVRKYDVTKAYENVMSFYDLRRNYKDCFIIPPELESVQSLNIVTFLPYTDEEGRILILFNLRNWIPDEVPFEEAARTVVNVLDIVSMNPKCQINGVIGIHDLRGITFRHISEALKNGRLFAMLNLAQYGYPWRMKKPIFLNCNGLVRFVLRIIKPLLLSKVAQRSVFLGSDVKDLHQYVNPVLLPKSLQGSLEEEECDISQCVLNNLPYLRYERSFR